MVYGFVLLYKATAASRLVLLFRLSKKSIVPPATSNQLGTVKWCSAQIDPDVLSFSMFLCICLSKTIMAVPINQGTPLGTPKYYKPYHGDPQEGTPNFGKPHHDSKHPPLKAPSAPQT